MEDWINFTYRRRTLATGFKVKNPGPGKAAPGFATPFIQGKRNRVPDIFLQGDDNGNVYLLRPENSRGEFNFEYNVTMLYEYGDRVGAPSLQDIDGDGFTELFVPDYSNDL